MPTMSPPANPDGAAGYGHAKGVPAIRFSIIRFSLAAGLALGLGLCAGIAWADDPKVVHIAGVLYDGVESAWEKSFVDSFARVTAQHPHGLQIAFEYTEHVGYDQAEQVIRDYAEAGKYDIIFTDSSYADAVEKIHAEYPNTLFVFSGAGNHAVGGNGYWVTQHQNETGYLMGMIAGLMTRSNTVGVVGSFPGDETNAEVNGFFDGARAANPKVKRKLAYIQSWYDPQKSASATSALASAGADYILELAPAFEACQAAKVGCFGNYVDLNSLAPDVVVTSSLATWDPMINYILDQWWAHTTTKAAYNAPREAVWFGLPAGGTDLAPYHGWDAKLTDGVKASVADTKAKIISGEKKLPANFDNPVAD
jgi:basic membrane lipoprotein Med (substrate-binding protein (PBP1-ABC) superfamily)